MGTQQSVIGQFFSLSLGKGPEVFAKVNSAQFPSLASRVAGSRRFNVAAKGFDWSPFLSSRELNPRIYSER